MRNKYIVYRLLNENNTVIWVGQTNDLDRRLQQHRNDPYGALYGKTFTWEILAQNLTKKQSLVAESNIIAVYRAIGKPLLNQATYSHSVGIKRDSKAIELQREHLGMKLVDSMGNSFHTVKDAAEYHRLSEATVSRNANRQTSESFSRKDGTDKFRKERVSFKWEKYNE